MFAAFSQTLVQACTHTRTYIWCVADSCLYLYVKHAQTPALLSLRLVWASHEIKVSVLFLSSLFSLSLHFDIYFLFYMYACKHVHPYKSWWHANFAMVSYGSFVNLHEKRYNNNNMN